MDTFEVTEDINIQKLITERDKDVPTIISSLDDVQNVQLILENVKICIKYLPTYTISNVVEELLRYIIPVIKRSLLKVYGDNFLLSDTVDDDIVVNILKQNLQEAIEFIQLIRTILDFLSTYRDINLNILNNIPVDLAEVILCTFEHCKNSDDVYKTTFNTELLEIFRLTQEVHLLLLKLFESCTVIISGPNGFEVQELNKVLEIICNMSHVLSEISIKSMSDNWKGYVAIIQKFSSVLSDTVNLKLPVQSVTALISRNLNSLDNLDDVDLKVFTQAIKIVGFLIKVALKLFDIFWSNLETISKELLTMCCIIYSYHVDIGPLEGHSPDALNLIEISFYKPLEPFLLHLASDPVCGKILSLEYTPAECPFGFIMFLDNILNQLILSECKPEHFDNVSVIRAIFNSTKLCYTEFFWESRITRDTFDNLLLNITASVLIYDGYTEVERILLENVLQEHVWSAILAIEVWNLLLYNSTTQMCLETLLNLIKKHQEIDFGIYTNRLEQVYLKCLMQRIFKMLPLHMKTDIIGTCGKNIVTWKMMEFHNFPMQRKSVIDDICADVVDLIDTIEQENFSLNNCTFIAEYLGVLSTAKFNEIGVNSKRLTKSVYRLWEFNSDPDLINNNVFKYFMSNLCKITSILVAEFSTKELITILTQLKFISSDDFYKLSVCEILTSLSKRPVEYNQEETKIINLIVDIISPNLLSTKISVIKQTVLEVIHKFAINGKPDIVKNVMGIASELQGEISNYLQNNAVRNKFDKDYLTSLGNFKFQHECITWKNHTLQPRLKKQKLAGSLFTQETRIAKEKDSNERKEIIKSVVPTRETKIFQSNDHGDESVSEVLNNMKGEVKCLLNVLKTEKLSRKNASDIKLIANQLLSLL